MPVILNVTHSNIYKNQIVKCKNVIRILLKIKIFILSKSRRRLINNAEKFTHTHTSNIHALDNTTSQYSEIVLPRSSLTKIIYYERVETKLERSDSSYERKISRQSKKYQCDDCRNTQNTKSCCAI